MLGRQEVSCDLTDSNFNDIIGVMMMIMMMMMIIIIIIIIIICVVLE